MEAKIFSAKKSASMLIETMIGLFLIAVVLLGIMSAFSMSLASIVEVRDGENAKMIAVGLLNELEGVGFLNLKTYARNLLEKSQDHYPGFTIAAKDADDIVKMYPATDPVSAELTIALQRNGQGRAFVMTREVSRYDLSNASDIN